MVTLAEEEEIVWTYYLNQTLYLASFNVCTLNRIGQQGTLPRTLETNKVDVCCVSEAHIQCFLSIITLRNSDTTFFSRFALRVSDSLVRPITPTKVVVSSRFVPTIDYFWRILTFVIGIIGSVGALLRLQVIGFRVIALPLVTDGVD